MNWWIKGKTAYLQFNDGDTTVLAIDTSKSKLTKVEL